jgi:hypothetical protein
VTGEPVTEQTIDWQGSQQVDEATFWEVLSDSVALLRQAEVPFALLGGIASSALGRPRWTHDIDVFVRRDDAEHALELFGQAGYATDRANEYWLFKAVKHGVLVDLLFKSTGGIYLDDEMLARVVTRRVRDLALPILAPEDIVVIKALAFDEEQPHHWWDALGILAACELDWDYLLRRASHGARRMLSLLLFAQSNDLLVPDTVIAELYRRIYPA